MDNYQLNQALLAIVNHPERGLAGLAAAVVQDGALRYEGYFGRRYIGEKRSAGLPVTAETLFRIASISKLVGTLGLMQLVEGGGVSLTADVSDYLPFELRNPNYPDDIITLEMLLSHTSSIRDASAYTIPIPYTLEAFFRPGTPYFEDGEHWAKQRPGTFFCYCNLNYGVMATVIEYVTGVRFDTYMEQVLFRPLGITASYNVAMLPDERIKDVGVLYRKIDGRFVAQTDDYRGVKPRPLAQLENPDVQADYEAKFGRPQLPQDLAAYQIGTNGTLFSPQGGLRISVRGLVRLMQLILNGGEGILAPESLKTMMGERWRYDAAAHNGDNYNGLMRSWGLSVQHFLGEGAAGAGDKLRASDPPFMVGHLGEAYGLLSGLLFDVDGKHGVVYAFSGTPADLERYPSHYSSFTYWEEAVLTTLLSAL